MSGTSRNERVLFVHENQRWLGFWSEPLNLPFTNSDWPAWSDRNGQPVALSSLPEVDGESGWSIVRTDDADEDGWHYGTAFSRLQYERPGGRASMRMGDLVRTRIWKKTQLDKSGSSGFTRGGARRAHPRVHQATITSVWSAISDLLKDAIQRHRLGNLLSIDVTGLFLVVVQHQQMLRAQQKEQLDRLVVFGDEKQETSSHSSGGSPVHITTAPLDLLDLMISGAKYARASYGYVMAAGHLASITTVAKLFFNLPLFDPIKGVSKSANNRALCELGGFDPEDVLLTEWTNTSFKPCHYVAVDRVRNCVVLTIRGSLELGDICTDLTATPMRFDFQGVKGHVHQGLLRAAMFVHCNTADALRAGAERCPSGRLRICGHSLGGGVAALLTLLLKQPGGAPAIFTDIQCVTLAPAAVVDEPLARLCEDHIISVILECDLIPRLSCHSVERLLLDFVNASLSRKAASGFSGIASQVQASLARLKPWKSQGDLTSAEEEHQGRPRRSSSPQEEDALSRRLSDGLKCIPELVFGTNVDWGAMPEGCGEDDWCRMQAQYLRDWFGNELPPGRPAATSWEECTKHKKVKVKEVPLREFKPPHMDCSADATAKSAGLLPVRFQDSDDWRATEGREFDDWLGCTPRLASETDSLLSISCQDVLTRGMVPGHPAESDSRGPKAAEQIGSGPQLPFSIGLDEAAKTDVMGAHPEGSVARFVADGAAGLVPSGHRSQEKSVRGDLLDASGSPSPLRPCPNPDAVMPSEGGRMSCGGERVTQPRGVGPMPGVRPGHLLQVSGGSSFPALFPRVDEEKLLTSIGRMCQEMEPPARRKTAWESQTREDGSCGTDKAKGQLNTEDMPAVAVGCSESISNGRGQVESACRRSSEDLPSTSSSADATMAQRVTSFHQRSKSEQVAISKESLEREISHVPALVPAGRILWLLSPDMLGPGGLEALEEARKKASPCRQDVPVKASSPHQMARPHSTTGCSSPQVIEMSRTACQLERREGGSTGDPAVLTRPGPCHSIEDLIAPPQTVPVSPQLDETKAAPEVSCDQLLELVDASEFVRRSEAGYQEVACRAISAVEEGGIAAPRGAAQGPSGGHEDSSRSALMNRHTHAGGLPADRGLSGGPDDARGQYRSSKQEALKVWVERPDMDTSHLPEHDGNLQQRPTDLDDTVTFRERPEQQVGPAPVASADDSPGPLSLWTKTLAAGLAAIRTNAETSLCTPGWLSTSSQSAAAREFGPLVIQADRKCFEQMFLHRSGFADHIPDNYLNAIRKLAEAYGRQHEGL